MKSLHDRKIVITGIAGLVGQNLALRLHKAGYKNIYGIDKHSKNIGLLKDHQPYLTVIEADLAEQGEWRQHIVDCDVLVLNQAQIGGLNYIDFERNNITATQNILSAIDDSSAPYIVHISSSVVNSKADDFYTQSKTEQEKIVRASRYTHVVLRPTLMFGWFDRKHLGWLRRFMEKVPVFPIPGHGKYQRQPLYVGDFCNVIMACIAQQPNKEVYDISGQETLDYIDLIRTIKRKTGQKTPIINIPYSLFFLLLWLASLVLRNPPFTIHQLRALIIPEVFPVIDWPTIFGIKATKFEDAVDETYNDPEHSSLILEF